MTFSCDRIRTERSSPEMLTECPDCKCPVSDQAHSCPGCGLPRPGVSRQRVVDAEVPSPPVLDGSGELDSSFFGSDFVELIEETSEGLVLRVAFTTKLDPVREAVDAAVLRFILTRALAQNGGNVTRTAQIVGLSRKTMQTYIKLYMNREILDD